MCTSNSSAKRPHPSSPECSATTPSHPGTGRRSRRHLEAIRPRRAGLVGLSHTGKPPLPLEGVDNVAAVPTAVIVAYDPAWPVRAQQLLNEVRSVLVFLTEADHFAYEHIGSTAVPGLAAKPIVDLQVRMPSLPDLADLADILGRTPFVPAHGARPDSPGVHRDIPRPGDATDAALYEKRLFHAPSEAAILHIRRTDSPFAQFVVEFRDWLRHHPDQAGRYEQLKRTLATQHADDPDYDDYTRAKSTFLNKIQPQMRAWAQNRTL